jgi:predicted nucleotidyltransferase
VRDSDPMNKNEFKATEALLGKAKSDEDVLAVMIFGSEARRERRSTSDVDICLVLDPLIHHTKKKSYSQKRLEYLKDFDFDIQIFQQLPLFIRKRILKEGRVLFVRDERNLYELAWRTARAFDDFRHIHEAYLKEVESGG